MDYFKSTSRKHIKQLAIVSAQCVIAIMIATSSILPTEASPSSSEQPKSCWTIYRSQVLGVPFTITYSRSWLRAWHVTDAQHIFLPLCWGMVSPSDQELCQKIAIVPQRKQLNINCRKKNPNLCFGGILQCSNPSLRSYNWSVRRVPGCLSAMPGPASE